MTATGIQERMEVVGSCGNHVGVVDHVENEQIKLVRNDPKANGQHHYIPLEWVESVDDCVHLNKDCEESFRDWRPIPFGISQT